MEKKEKSEELINVKLVLKLHKDIVELLQGKHKLRCEECIYFLETALHNYKLVNKDMENQGVMMAKLGNVMKKLKDDQLKKDL
jgi:hypothetical protein